MIVTALVGINPATPDTSTPTKVKLGLTVIEKPGSAVAIGSAVPPGTQLSFDKMEVWFPIAEGDFIRPGLDFQQIKIRTASWWELVPGQTYISPRRIMLIITAAGVGGSEAWLRTREVPRVHGIAGVRDTVAAATNWGARLQNHDGINGGNKEIFVHGIQLGHDGGAGTIVRARIDFDQEKIGTGVGGEIASYVRWEGVPVDAGNDRVLPQPLCRWVTKIASAADPAPVSAAAFTTMYLTLAPENFIHLDPPARLRPGREIRVWHLSAPGLTGWASADVSGDVVPEDA
jgi:hypothetical protein